jgi:hypothetical protein
LHDGKYKAAKKNPATNLLAAGFKGLAVKIS